MKIRLDLEKTVLIVFFAILLFIGPGNLFGHRIKHDFPYAYLSSDAFQHQIRAEAIKDAGNFRHEAFYISHGFEKVTGRYPPVIYHLAVILSYTAGLEAYDSIYFIVYFFAIFGAFVMYFIIRMFNKNIALIALPLAIIMISPQLYIDQNDSLVKTNFGINVGFAYGHWPSLLAQSFLIAFAWWIANYSLEKSYIPIAIIFSAIILSHTSEAIFAIIFLAIFFAVKFINKNLKKSEIINIIFALGISFAVTAYYIIIFWNTWRKYEAYHFVVEPIWKGNPGVYIASFGFLLVFIAAGIIFSLFKFKDMHASLIFGFAMILSGFLNYIGFGLRSFQIRFFWPIYLSVFFGFGLYMLLKFIIKEWKMVYSISLFIAFTILLLGIIKIQLIPSYSKVDSQGLMDVYHWSALEWLSKNTESSAKIYFFYGDIYDQDALLRNSKRFHYQISTEDFVKSVQERKIKRYYISELPGDYGGIPAIRTGVFTFEYPFDKNTVEYFYGPKDLCSFNYIVFDKVSRQKVFGQYNAAIASELLKKDYISRVFENEAVVILKNNDLGADCIEERNF